MAFKLPSFKASKPSADVALDDVPLAAAEGASGRISLLHLGLSIFLLAAILVTLIAVLFQQDAANQGAESRRQEITLTADHLADRIATQLQQNAAKMELLAREADFVELVTQNDEAALRQREAQLGYLFPNSIRVRIVRPGLTEVDLNTSPPLSYAALDMLRQAETTETPPAAEVHLFGTPQQHINLVRRVLSANGRRIVGHLMVSFPLPMLQAALDSPKLTRGYGEVWQVVDAGQPVVLATRGNRALREGKPTVEVNIPGSRWKVAYWSESAGFGASEMGLWLIAGSGIVIFGLLLVLILRSFDRAFKQDQVLLLGAVRDARNGRLKDDYALMLKECAGVVAAVRQLYAADTAAIAPQAKAAPGVQAAVNPSTPTMAAHNTEAATAVSRFTNVGVDLTSHASRQVALDASIFLAYDIRGIVGKGLTPDSVRQIGRAIGSEARARGEQIVIVARDGRLSGPELQEALMRGLRASGVMVKDIGQVPTPVLYYATNSLDTRSGVILTGSHNPPNYNGLKIVLAGETLSGAGIQRLRERIEKGELDSGSGGYEKIDIIDKYIDRIRKDVQLARNMKVVLDCGNGVAGAVAPQLMDQLGCQVIPLHCAVDGGFPNHHPDPSKPENLQDLIKAVREQKADVGMAFDGDGDRVGVVDSDGKIIWPDRLLMLLAMDILGRNPGAEIIYDVKCTRHLPKIIRDFGGNPEMWKTGHSLIKARMKETGALLAGEMSGHIFFKERWYGFDDGLYSAARLLEILSNDHRSSSKVFAALPEAVSTPELNLPLQEGEPKAFMTQFLTQAQFDGAEMTTIDGLRADFDDGWGLVRASNTTPCLVIRFEAEDEVALQRIQEQFRRAMLRVDADLKLPF